MKKLKVRIVEKYIAFSEIGLYLTDDEKFVGDAFGPMGPGRYTPIDTFYKEIPFLMKLRFLFNEFMEKIY
jgi:hypothetical protein